MQTFRIKYQTIEFENSDIHIRSLRDKLQFADPLGEAESLGISSAQWPLFGVLWDSGQILAHEMESFAFEGKRILEVGCGIALSSLLLNSFNADITATDIHPESGAFLVENTRLNNHANIPFLRADWKDPSDGLGKFDVIIGSDILYEKQHILLLSYFINQHSNAESEVIIVDPGRSNHAQFTKKMLTHNYQHVQYDSSYTKLASGIFKGKVLRYTRTK